MSFRCFIGLHDWRSTFLYRIEGVMRPAYVLYGRDMWGNRCARCGRTEGPTFRYEKSSPPTPASPEEPGT